MLKCANAPEAWETGLWAHAGVPGPIPSEGPNPVLSIAAGGRQSNDGPRLPLAGYWFMTAPLSFRLGTELPSSCGQALPVAPCAGSAVLPLGSLVLVPLGPLAVALAPGPDALLCVWPPPELLVLAELPAPMLGAETLPFPPSVEDAPPPLLEVAVLAPFELLLVETLSALA